ncbi:DUF6531 domain-containing protein [Chitinophaga pinensis]|uniref:YD repeat-containing protein n=1 Tax=Chitinophaga pinensis (strain ATCC 43595 / DSM 2588 / LMG 13176 / NBRC 15968 / NCIMB 11800 / UQM 2034) TaxID=485918 RepID=A0A979GAP7_CHIPD|nr:DUF6531 domain-containing protein [Chitinophaga pinensis]ACU63822.1 YD repeat-containing protein [Chitinophaga pinensis DSM 2588]
MLVSNKHFIPVIGLDIHIVILLGFPIPLPHPYIGFVIDPMDYIPFLGATTKVNHVPRGVSDTSGIIVILFHIPMGGPWLLAPMIGHDSVNFFGSKTVKAEGRLLSPTGHMLMTCNDIGIPLSLQPGKKLKPIPSMYLPTSFSIPLSFGKPVMVGGPYIPDWAGVLMNLITSFGFGALMKGVGKLGKKAVTKFNHALKGKIGSNKLSKNLCKMGFEPVDLVQGIVVNEGVDFELPGPIPLKWERSWNSDSPHKGLLGHATHLSYDMRVEEFIQEDATVVLLGDGRSAVFDLLIAVDNSDYNRHERLTLKRTDIDEYQLYNHENGLYYTFRKTYEGAHQYHLSAIHNKAQFIISFHYNHRGSLVRVIDSVGRHLHVSSDAAGRITGVSVHHHGQEKRLISYGYNDEGDLIAVTDALEQTMHITYANHLMIKKTDRNGQSFYWAYDKKHRCIHTWGDDGLLEGYIEYYPEDGFNIVTNSLDQQTTYYYTPDYVVHQIKDPLGHSTFTEYTPDFEIYREINEEGDMTGYSYDEEGRVTAVVYPDASISTHSYDENGYMAVSTDAQGNSTSYVYYQDNGLLHSLTSADGSLELFEYNERNLLSKVTDFRGGTTLFAYDEDCNLTTLTLPEGGTTSWAYDAWGQCIKAVNPLEQEQLFRYDKLGRVIEILAADGNRTELQYDAYDDVTRMTDKQRDIRYTYTPLGSLKSREENNTAVRFIHDTEDLLCSIINEHGETFRFRRDMRGDIIGETRFDGLNKHYKRDAAGKLIHSHYDSGKYTDYEYNAIGLLTRIEQSDGSWEIYSYDRNGHVTEATNENSSVKFVRDALGRIVEEWQDGHQVMSVYDKQGRRTAISSAIGADIKVQRDQTGYLTGMHVQTAGNINPWVMHIERNLMGLEIERNLPGGVKSKRSYHQSGLIATHTVSSGANITRSRHYRWDVNDRLKSIVNALESGNGIKYGHDDFGNLAWAQYEDGQFDYRLPDKTGNLYKTTERKDRKYTSGGQLKETADARYSYDAEGNLTEKLMRDLSLWKYEWYGNGMLKKVIRPDRREVQFEYDALGRRTAKIFGQQITRWVWNGGKPLHEWHYNVAERPVTVIDDTGNVYRDPEPVPVENLTTWVFDPESHLLLAKICGGVSYSIITDHIGTPCQAYDEEGNIVWSCELDIYGKVRKLAGPIDFIPFRYQGQYEDVETGLYYNRYRYYSPDEGIYISQDPLAPLAGLRFYSYVTDPNAWVDLLGLVAGPAGLPDSPGIYILTNGKQSYVGSSGIGEQGMRSRISDLRHANAQDLLEMDGTKVQYVKVDLGDCTDPSERNNILRYYEQREFDKQAKKTGMTMLNDPNKRIQSAKKKAAAEALIKKYNVKASKRRVTVKCK